MSKPSPAGLVARSSRIPRLLAVVVLVCAFVAPAAASAATAPPFEPTLVISDDVFRASGSMSVADIQAFLERYPGVLDTTYAPRHADGSMALVSQLIWEVSQELNVNPKILLTTLQKEQSLLTKTAPTQTTLDWALGMGCPDGSTPETRDQKYRGLGNQIWYAAQRLDGYAESSWVPNQSRSVCLRCQWDSVTKTWAVAPVWEPAFVPANKATFKLYTYTPHSHDSTVGGGNYLFWVVYWRYFDEGPLASPARQTVYRFYNLSNGSHFYTTSEAERYTVIRKWPSIYRYEGPGYYINTANPANNVTLYRFYNKKNGSHFYTVSTQERDDVIAKWPTIYSYEGPAYNVSLTPDGATTVYRFYNKKNGSHFYTTSPEERDTVIGKYPTIYNYEGVAYYVGN